MTSHVCHLALWRHMVMNFTSIKYIALRMKYHTVNLASEQCGTVSGVLNVSNYFCVYFQNASKNVKTKKILLEQSLN
jgi:hypothetical protein